jgi:hypothetical protein
MVKPLRHKANSRLDPKRSLRYPVRGITKAMAKRYIVRTSWARSSEAPKEFMMVGKATFTTVVSSNTMKLATIITNRTRHL